MIFFVIQQCISMFFLIFILIILRINPCRTPLMGDNRPWLLPINVQLFPLGAREGFWTCCGRGSIVGSLTLCLLKYIQIDISSSFEIKYCQLTQFTINVTGLLLQILGRTLALARFLKLRVQFMHWALKLLSLMMSCQLGRALFPLF